MKLLTSVRVCIALAPLLCCSPAISQAQSNQPDRNPKKPPSVGDAPQAADNELLDVTVLYTGRLMGYFREPNWQSPTSDDSSDCPIDLKPGGGYERLPMSHSAVDFDMAIAGATMGSVLVGSGDNFAPELAAREFCVAPALPGLKKVNLPPGPRVGKDLFVWNPFAGADGAWVPNEAVRNDEEEQTRRKAHGMPTDPRSLSELLKSGRGFIPRDNVAKFLTKRGYSAVVPGRHDFYFGPEHVRQVARLLAGSAIPEPERGTDGKPKFMPRHAESVQMLGANIVIETSWRDDHAPLTDTERPPTFVPRFPRALELANIKDLDIQLAGLKDGDTVYPWFTGVTVTFSRANPPQVLAQAKASYALKAGSEIEKRAAVWEGLKTLAAQSPQKTPTPLLNQTTRLIKLLDQSHPRLCLVPRARSAYDFDNPENKDEDPAIFQYGRDNCRNLDWQASVKEEKSPLPQASAKKEEKLILTLDFPWLNQTSKKGTLLAGERYRLCFSADERTFCIRFSTYVPLLQSSWAQQGPSPDCEDGQANCQHRNPMALCRNHSDCVLHEQHDPAPYALIARPGHDPSLDDVVVFGVVDPHLGETIGLLNLAWYNDHHDFKTQVAFKDPGEAIKQLSEYFDRKYREEHSAEFKGIKVLLAQMSPQEAQVLAKRGGNFHVVVSAADQDMANLETTYATWTPSPTTDATHPQYVAIPYPHYITQKDKNPYWTTDIGSLQVQHHNSAWLSTSRYLEQHSAIGITPLQLDQWFVDTLVPSVRSKCFPKGFTLPIVPADEKEMRDQRLDYIQTMTLCAMQSETEADIALLQKRDIFADLPDYVDHLALSHRRTQEILDRIIWKGDFLQLIYVPGSALKKIFDQSKAFDDDDKSSLSLADERNRGLLKLGVSFDSDRKEYAINGLTLDPNKLYSVATSEYIAMGDTGYPDFASSQVTPPVVPWQIGDKFRTISSVVCGSLPPGQDCTPSLNGKDYFDESVALPDDPRFGKTSLRQLELWSVFERPSKVLGSDPPPPTTALTAADKVVANRTLWDFNLAKWSMGLTRLAHTGNNFDVKSLFGGLTSSEPSTVSSTTWTSDLNAQLSRSWQRRQIFVSPGYTYNLQHKGQPDDLDQVTQNANRGSLDVGYAESKNLRQPEHADYLFTAHFETPLTTAFTNIALKTTHPGTDGSPIKDQLRIHLDRSYTLSLRPGFRWKRRISAVEFGPEYSHEWKALTGINFLTGPTVVSCSAKASTPLSVCASNALSIDPKALTTKSIVFTDRNNQDHTGIYWKINMTVPFHHRVSYVLTDAGDYYPVRYATENSTTTLLRDYSQHQLKFDIFPSLSIGPEFDALLYRNKAVTGLNGHFLFQDQVLMKAQWNFDLFNWRNKRKQLIYAPPSSK